MPASADDVLAFCRLYLSEEEAERLVGWIAWRTGRNQAMAGSRPALGRLTHALAHWLSGEQRARLLSWLERRRERREPLVPS